MEEQLDNHLGHLDTRQGQPESSTTPPEVNDILSLLCVRVYKPPVSDHQRHSRLNAVGVATSSVGMPPTAPVSSWIAAFPCLL